MDQDSRTDGDKKRRKEARRAEKRARKRVDGRRPSYVLLSVLSTLVLIPCHRINPLLKLDEVNGRDSPPLEADVTELPYAALTADVVEEQHGNAAVVRREESPTVVRSIHLPQHDSPCPPQPPQPAEQDLADALVCQESAPLAPLLVNTLEARPRTRKDGLGAAGWNDRMQDWKQSLPGNATYVQDYRH